MKSCCQVYYFGHISSTSILKRLLCYRKMMSALCLFNEIKRAFLFSRDLFPPTLGERILKFTFSLLLRTNFSHQNCTKTGRWKIIHFRICKQWSYHLRTLNQKMLTSSVQNIITIITKIERNTYYDLKRS